MKPSSVAVSLRYRFFFAKLIIDLNIKIDVYNVHIDRDKQIGNRYGHTDKSQRYIIDFHFTTFMWGIDYNLLT